MTKQELCVLGVVGAATFVGMGYFVLQSETKRATSAAAIGQVRGQLGPAVAKWMDGPLQVAKAGQKIRPKVAIVDAKQRAIDECQLLLPAALAAARPDDVKTLVVMQCESRQTATYTSGDKAFVEACAVKVVDLESRAVIATTTIQGPPPPSQKRLGSGSKYGPRPTDAIVAFVSSLSALPVTSQTNP